jgi:drug/metabolite transporter (DMT)-like permease
MTRPVAVLLLVACTMLWGFAFVVQKGAMQHMGPLTFSLVRYFVGAVLVTPLAIAEYRRRARGVRTLSRGQWLRIGALSLAFFCGVWLQQHALLTATVTNSGFLTALYVIFTPLVTYALVRTRPHPVILVGAPLALVGIYLLTGARLDRFTPADGELVLCAVFWAIQVSMLGALVKETGLPLTVSVITFYATAVLATAGAFALEHPTLEGIGDGWLFILYAGVFSTGIAFTLQAIGQQHIPSANAAIILSAESLFAALSGALFLGERLPPLGYLGAAIIFGSIVLVEAIPVLRSRAARVEPTWRESA